MDIVVPKNTLLRLVTRCQGVADKKSAMPALANVLLSAEAGSLRLAATDLYLGISGSCSVEIAKPGSVAVPAKDLLERVKAMPDGPVQILVNDASAQTTLKAVGSPRRYTLHGIPGSEFPSLPKPAEGAPVIDLEVAALSLLIARTHFSISNDETRVNVNSALFEWSGDIIRAVSTDGHRLSKMEIGVPVGGLNPGQILIPLKAISELRRLTDEARGEKDATTVKLVVSGPNAFFDIAGMVFSVKTVDAVFPPYQQVIPKTSAHSFRAPRGQLRDAVKAVSLAASDRTGGVKLSMDNGMLRITSESPESGNGFDELSVDYHGPATAIGLNAKYVIDVLDAIEDDEVTLGVDGELDPVVVRPANDSQVQRYIAVVMPVRI